ncbi:MAG: 1-deoxy-D-xylulose-5-phosphate reductoisomerase, partial [Clostridia bacterium]|nr:1-deoxy-D-xylulose-5-phosphate reductoisomerase [Clostridia bacterium]
RISFAKLGQITFAQPDEETFRCLALAKEAGRQGGIMPTVLNAANEVAVAKFLSDEIEFLEIPEIIEKALTSWKNVQKPTLDDLLIVDREVREYAKLLGGKK